MKFTNEEFSDLFLELSMLLQAKVSPGDALMLLSKQAPAQQKPVLEKMAVQVDGGEPLSKAMKDAGMFPSFVWGLVESSPRTEQTLAALSEYYENKVRLERQVRSAVLYPAVMLAVMLAVIGVLLVRVLPVFDDVYASLGGQLDGVAGGLLALGQGLSAGMPVLLAILGVLAVGAALFAWCGPVRSRLTAFWRNVWGDRGMMRKVNTAQVAQAMSLAMSSGRDLDKAVELAGYVLSDVPAAQARCRDCLERLDRGQGAGQALEESGLLPAAQCRLLSVTQKHAAAGLATAMEKAARDLNEESEAAIQSAVARVEPTLVLAGSVLTGLILLSVMLPLMHILQAIG